IAEVMTDKVNAEVPSLFTGVITELVAQEGETLEVGELICYIDTEESGETKKDTENTSVTDESEQVSAAQNDSNQSMKKRYSPAVLRMAQENDIDLNHVNGSGKGGRITRKDMEKLIASGTASKAEEEVPQVQKEQPESQQTVSSSADSSN